jgi:hypothetical protein
VAVQCDLRMPSIDAGAVLNRSGSRRSGQVARHRGLSCQFLLARSSGGARPAVRRGRRHRRPKYATPATRTAQRTSPPQRDRPVNLPGSSAVCGMPDQLEQKGGRREKRRLAGPTSGEGNHMAVVTCRPREVRGGNLMGCVKLSQRRSAWSPHDQVSAGPAFWLEHFQS